MNGVGIVSITQPFQEGPDGDLHRNVVAVFDDHQLKQLSSLSRRGLEDVVLAGGYIGSKAPFGYIRVKKVLRDGAGALDLGKRPRDRRDIQDMDQGASTQGDNPSGDCYFTQRRGHPKPGGQGMGEDCSHRDAKENGLHRHGSARGKTKLQIPP